MQRTISNTVILAQSVGLQKMTAWLPLAKRQMLRRRIQRTVLIGKGTQAQDWACLAVHSRRGKQSRADGTYAVDGGHLHAVSHSQLEIVTQDKEEMCMSSLRCSCLCAELWCCFQRFWHAEASWVGSQGPDT